MSVVSFRIDEELKRKMERKRHVNWSGLKLPFGKWSGAKEIRKWRD